MKQLPRLEDVNAGRVVELARIGKRRRVVLILDDGDGEVVLVIARLDDAGHLDRFGSSFRGTLAEMEAAISKAKMCVRNGGTP